MKVLSGTSNIKLSKGIAKILKLKLVDSNIRRIADNEIYIEINENIRKKFTDGYGYDKLCLHWYNIFKNLKDVTSDG